MSDDFWLLGQCGFFLDPDDHQLPTDLIIFAAKALQQHAEAFPAVDSLDTSQLERENLAEIARRLNDALELLP